MKNLVIIGASAMGRETHAYAKDCGINVKGFLDSRQSILDGYDGYPPILCPLEDYQPCKDDVFVCAVGDPQQKRKYCTDIVAKGGGFISIIHPRAYVAPNVKIGEGCIVCPNASITTDVRIGSHVILNVNSSVNHDCTVGDYATISPGCNVAGWCSIGDSVFLGLNSACIPHVKLGDDVFVAAGALVISNVVAGRVMGVPARIK